MNGEGGIIIFQKVFTLWQQRIFWKTIQCKFKKKIAKILENKECFLI
jgi:hypothetical protein